MSPDIINLCSRHLSLPLITSTVLVSALQNIKQYWNQPLSAFITTKEDSWDISNLVYLLCWKCDLFNKFSAMMWCCCVQFLVCLSDISILDIRKSSWILFIIILSWNYVSIHPPTKCKSSFHSLSQQAQDRWIAVWIYWYCDIRYSHRFGIQPCCITRWAGDETGHLASQRTIMCHLPPLSRPTSLTVCRGFQFLN